MVSTDARVEAGLRRRSAFSIRPSPQRAAGKTPPYGRDWLQGSPAGPYCPMGRPHALDAGCGRALGCVCPRACALRPRVLPGKPAPKAGRRAGGHERTHVRVA